MMEQKSFALVSILLLIQVESTLSQEEEPESTTEKDELHRLADQLEYSSYLKEVMQLLHGDEELKVKKHLHNITNGNLVGHLKDVEDNVRTKLDELKRRELQRIRLLGEELKRRSGEGKKDVHKIVRSVSKHLDLKNLAQFGTEDLRKLLLQANGDLAFLDKKRREIFKEYEMHKELEFEELIKRLNIEDRKVVEKRRKELMIKHRNQKPDNMPLSKEHLLQVWEERDKMNQENFNTKTFFHLHDLDGNGFLDEYEVNVLITTKFEHTGLPSAPELDEVEKEADLGRKRKIIYGKADVNKDHLIDLEEFIAHTKESRIDDHTLWVQLFNEEVFTKEEYAVYAELHRDEVNRLIDEGQISLDLSGIVMHNKNEDDKFERKWRQSTV